MTITYSYPNGDYVVYTDGVCFTDPKNYNSLPGIKVTQQYTSGKPSMFLLDEGWWWVPSLYRMCVYTGQEIMSGNYLDITNRITVIKNIFVHLEEEIRLEPMAAGLQEDVYYDVTFFDKEGMLQELSKDLSILDSGNLIKWKNKIQLIDMLYG